MTRTESKPCSTICKAYHRLRAPPAASRGAFGVHVAGFCFAGDQLEPNDERGAASGETVNAERSAHRVHEGAHDEQAEPGAAGLHRVGVLEPAELLEDDLTLVGRD